MKCIDKGDNKEAFSSIDFPWLIYKTLFFLHIVLIVFALPLLIYDNSLLFFEGKHFWICVCIVSNFSFS